LKIFFILSFRPTIRNPENVVPLKLWMPDQVRHDGTG
jgi:hypothetical protein